MIDVVALYRLREARRKVEDWTAAEQTRRRKRLAARYRCWRELGYITKVQEYDMRYNDR